MFGATILVPILLGINPAIALLMNGIGTLIYTWVTRYGMPAYLGSSFAFISLVLLVISSYGGFQHAQSGFIFFGLFFIIMSFVVYYWGMGWIDTVMPPAVMGAVVAIIGLELAPVAAQQAGLSPQLQIPTDSKVLIVSLFTLFIGIVASLFFKGFLRVIPVLLAVVVGSILACVMGMIDIKSIQEASWWALPYFQKPIYDPRAIIIIAPASLVVLAEHISHLIVTAKITGRDLMKKPGLLLSLLGDGISNVISGFTGSPPNTTYGENIGVLAITKVYSVWVIRGAAVLVIIFSLMGKVSAALSIIPSAVMGGITLLLYGIIAVQGLRIFIEQKVDFSRNKNMVLGALTFVAGVSGATIHIGVVQLRGMSLAAIVGMGLSLVLWMAQKFLKLELNE